MEGWTKATTQSIRVNIAGTGGQEGQSEEHSGLLTLGALLLLLLLYFVFRRK